MYWFDIADELLPPVYRAIKDLYAYARTLDTELKESLANMMLVRENFFIQTCDIETIEYWESLLGIEIYGGETIEDRRQMILIYLNNRFPTSEPYVRYVMRTIFGEGNYDLEIDPSDPFFIHFLYMNADYDSIKRFVSWFNRMCPAHLMWVQTHVEPTSDDLYISCYTPSQLVSRSQATMSAGEGTLYLGSQSYTVPWIEV